MPVKIGHALKNEKGQYKGGQKGDQNGREILIAAWYLHVKGWVVIRAIDPKDRENIALAMEMICKNDNFGYGQDYRLSGFDETAKVGYDPSKVKIKCGLDCSQSVRLCVHYAGIKCANFKTKTQVDILDKTGKFEVLTSSKYCKSSDYLLRGDILCTPVSGHTVVVLSNGAKIKEEKSMGYTVIKNYVSKTKYSKKCPYTMKPIGITVHNTANDASAINEVKYMVGNTSSTSYHVAVDDKNVVLAVPFTRNAWHAGDGGRGNGNRKTIGIEICYSKSGGTKFNKAEENAAHYIATLLKEYGWTTKNVYRHKDWSGKNCPHRTISKGWSRFINMIQDELDVLNGKKSEVSVKPEIKEPATVDTKIDTVKEVQKWVNSEYTFKDVKVDGLYGNETKTALVKALQTELNQNYKKNLKVDGVFGSKTKSAIKTLKKGAKNDIVKVLQALLVCNGYKNVYVDGDYGTGTVNSVTDYKKKKKFKLVNGNAGSAMFASLCK